MTSQRLNLSPPSKKVSSKTLDLSGGLSQEIIVKQIFQILPLVFFLLAVCNRNDTVNENDKTNNLEYGSNIRKEEFDKV